MAGVEPAFAAKQLGHTTEMFLNTYADWISGVKDRDQVNLLNQIWAKIERIWCDFGVIRAV